MDRPYYHINFAMTADGRMANQDGSRLRISSPEDMRRVHLLRQELGAILVGVNTIIMDDPKLTVKEELVTSARPLTKIVLDTRGRTPPEARFLRTPGRSIIAIGKGMAEGPGERSRSGLEAMNGLDILEIDTVDGKLDLGGLSRPLLDRGVDRVLVEGGPSVIGAFIGSGLFDMLTIYIGPMLVGGNGPSFPKGIQHLDGEVTLRSVGSKGLGEGLLLEYSPIR